MCGIVGYIGEKEKRNFLLSGLKELEYRGYDSAGIAVLKGQDLQIFRSVGKLVNLENCSKDFESIGFGAGIGHTRWATHGKPTEANAHPHTAEFSSVVHNGIIENYKDIKKDLEKKGNVFRSQTDTEVIVRLFEELLSQHKEPLEAFKATIQNLQGAYAILLITKQAEGQIFYAKKGSPLIIGKGKDGVYFSSSDAPLIGFVQNVCYLEDGSIGVMDQQKFDELPFVRPFNMNKLYAQKEGYRYFMEKEIYEQHKVLLETMMGRIQGDSIHFEELNPSFFEGIEHIVLCACGTSYHAALVASYLFERLAKIKCNVAIASELRYREPIFGCNELFVVISQSGETADTLEALRQARQAGLKSLAICNVDNSSIVREAEVSILTRAGIEKGVASTKAFATQVMVLWLLACSMGQKRGVLGSQQSKAQITSMIKSVQATEVNEHLHDRLRRICKRYLHGHGFFFIGRDIFYPLALEGALKLKEISYLHAEGYPSGEMKHGPIALADSELFTIALMPQHLLYEKIKSNVEELAARDATICVMSATEFDLADDMLLLEQRESYMEEFFEMMVALQLFALEVSIRLGNDVDMPRNLAKSVTVE
ncbi:glutamine--fructose-6-phosphate transaminase (isomerizing) [Helicobacter monodelphidis]|uniref:glutamine--fructose-6-phosphate transaminase (isomerizing) n=1 Tax=Helicobacter sp. 15-1451 TaxID=2004995 RepID=UPI000DCB027E|nr:glutamine--fructose-6-phosphate transaminase (isomerizing) [Helicobacter sp. 15-1451]RAX57189.1 glutamine--fructose-6-phosphate transaminase (isomerizing) [Helicobacter sp. 15-1451]